jgi:putative ABC transport system ATP-binding protein
VSDPIAVLENVIKRYREGDAEHVVLDGASATIAAGEFVALLGPSGSGKSTVLNLLAGIDLADAGTVRVGGQDMGRLDETARTRFRRRSVGFVFQFFNLIPTLTVEENLLLPLDLNGMEDGPQRAAGLLERVGLAERASSWPDHLSGGEQQRIAIARALIHEPQLLLADEPTGNLDEDTGVRVLDLLEEMTRGAAGTLVVVTHSEALAGRADRVLRLQHGRLLET